jgi:nitrous oxide reductase accessory protein NosL
MTRKSEDIGAIMRIYVRDLEKVKTWQPPKAEIST